MWYDITHGIIHGIIHGVISSMDGIIMVCFIHSTPLCTVAVIVPSTPPLFLPQYSRARMNAAIQSRFGDKLLLLVITVVVGDIQ